MAASNRNPNFHLYRSNIDGSTQGDFEATQQGGWYNTIANDGSYDLLSSPLAQPLLNAHGGMENDPPFHFGGYTTYSSDSESMVDGQVFPGNTYSVGASTSQGGTASGLLLAQTVISAETQAYLGGDAGSVYNSGDSDASGSSVGAIVSSQSYGRNDSTFHVGRSNSDGGQSAQAELAYSSMAQITVASSAVGRQGLSGGIAIHDMPVDDTYASESAVAPRFQSTATMSMATLEFPQNTSPYPPLYAAQGSGDSEQRHRDLTYHGPIHHASIQLANNRCFGNQRRGRAMNHRSAPYPVVYHQERSRGQIYNGNIYGGVKNFNISNVDGAVLQYLKDHAATGAMHDSDERFPPPLCHPGTREAMIFRILDWYGYQAGPGKSIMWIHAPAGYGKTAIAGTIAEKLEEKLKELNFNPLGATFFFWRTSPERNGPARFIITLAYQLSMSVPELASHVESAVKRNPMILTKALEVQMKKLVIEPFEALGDTKHMPNRLIIIDGVDECINSDRESRIQKKYAEDQETVQIRVLNLIRALASHQLPLSFLILSRPEAWIKQRMQSHQFNDIVEIVDLCEVGNHMQDVETFVRAELSHLRVADENLVRRLLKRASGHMLFASTVVRHIDCPYDDPQTRLQNILTYHSSSNSDLARSTPFSSLHELYRQILRSCPEGNHTVMIEVLEDLEAAEGTFNASEVDVDRAVSILDHLSGRVPGAGMKAIRGLHAVLNLTGSANDDYLRIGRSSLTFFIHSSFGQFLSDPRLSLEFHVDEKKGSVRLLSGCLHPIPSIALDSELDADHLRYALVAWMPIWYNWSYAWAEPLAEPEIPVLLAMLQKLLNVDLTPYFVHAFTDRHLDEVLYDPEIDTDISSAGPENSIIPIQTIGAEAIYDSQPLARQAVSYIRASYEAAVHHLLKTHHPTKHYNASFFIALAEFLFDFTIPTGEIDTKCWDSTGILDAMKTLKRESPEHFRELMEGVLNTYQDKLMERGVWEENPQDLEEERSRYAQYEYYILDFMNVIER